MEEKQGKGECSDNFTETEIAMERIKKIQPPDAAAMERAQARWNGVAKPLHSLGLLEEAVVRIAGMTGSEEIDLSKRCVVCLCADNGVVCEGVTQTDSSVTRIVAQAMAEGSSNINRMAEVFHADVAAVDVGMLEEEKNSTAAAKGGEKPHAYASPSRLIVRKAGCGTANIANGPAMTREQAIRTIQTGMDIVQKCAADGYRIVVTGEMGIGNTTTSSALASVLLGLAVEEVTGRGAGLSPEGIRHKCEVIEKAIRVNFAEEIKAYHKNAGGMFAAGTKFAAGAEIAKDGRAGVYPGAETGAGANAGRISVKELTALSGGCTANAAITLLSRLGGFDIAAMVGVYLGGAIYRVPVVIDGFISAVAAVLAVQIAPLAKEYMLASHVSAEPAGAALLSKLGLEPCIRAGLCLGEGTGGVLLLPLLDGALSVYRSSHRFDELPMESYKEL